MTFDPTKPVRTRNGRPARIICTGASGYYPIVALVEEGGTEDVFNYTPDGNFYLAEVGSDLDLINVPERHVRWVNVYPPEHACYGYATKAAADRTAATGRIACVRIEFEEGDGLS